MRATRLLVGLLGLGAAAYGAKLLLDLGVDNLVATLEWVVGGVAIHDGLVAPLCVVLGAVLVRLTRGRAPAPVVVGAIVLGTVTIAAVPVLGRFGARADNPTLLDRSYVAGWWWFAGLTVLLVLVAVLVERRRARRGPVASGRREGQAAATPSENATANFGPLP
ncbi:MAG TPA: hypothetical protein VFE07_11100 [Marmoricola sp.]|nr:hypothetical protein [Marmoricola sp.]